jgi:hypothetical protein
MKKEELVRQQEINLDNIYIYQELAEICRVEAEE